jgi:hypothetical protein
MTKRPLAALLAATLLAAPIGASQKPAAKPAASVYYPELDWERRAPEAVGEGHG